MSDKEQCTLDSSQAKKINLPNAENKNNQIKLTFKSRSENVALARLLASAIVSERDMTLAELDEIKVAVSEAVSNAIIHGYQNDRECWVEMSMELTDNEDVYKRQLSGSMTQFFYFIINRAIFSNIRIR